MHGSLLTIVLIAGLGLSAAEDKAEVNIRVSGACSPNQKAEGVEILKPVRNLLAEVEMRIGGTPDPNNPTLPCTKKNRRQSQSMSLCKNRRIMISMFITVYLMDMQPHPNESYLSAFGKGILQRRMAQSTVACFLMGLDVTLGANGAISSN
ncbi:hypothetical protein M3Y94_00634600 [Aphelenchoides besseyi]|nr:hypothetical protein M3Y94_00634600 [Aphelenchoides besseyi]